MPFIDIGANLTNHRFNECLIDVLEDAYKWGVNIILTGTNLKNVVQSKNLCYKYPKYNLHYTSGIHPHDTKQLTDLNFKIIENACQDEKCVAIGECGLDYDRMFSPKDIQLYWFEEQIKLGIKYNKPLFLHERSAFDDCYKILKKYKIKGVIHCFTGTTNQMKQYLDLGLHIGITGWLCDDRRNMNLILALRNFDKTKYLDKIMIETDCPFLSPVKEDKLNVPSYIYYVLKRLATELNLDEKELEDKIFDNTKKFFGL